MSSGESPPATEGSQEYPSNLRTSQGRVITVESAHGKPHALSGLRYWANYPIRCTRPGREPLSWRDQQWLLTILAAHGLVVIIVAGGLTLGRSLVRETFLAPIVLPDAGLDVGCQGSVVWHIIEDDRVTVP